MTTEFIKKTLIDYGVITEEQAKEIEEYIKKNSGIEFHQVVVDKNIADKNKVLYALSKAFKVKAVNLSEIEIDKEIAELIGEKMARQCKCIPFAKEEKTLFLAMADPSDLYIKENIHIKTGLDIKEYLAMPSDIMAAIDQIFGTIEVIESEEILKKIIEEQTQITEEDIQLEKKIEEIGEIDPNSPEVEKLVYSILANCIKHKASDIHIEPFEDVSGKGSAVYVRYRIDGVMHEATKIPWTYRNSLIAKIMVMTQTMNLTEKRKPQDGRISVTVKGKPVEFRVNVIPTVYGLSCVMRILDRSSIMVDLDKLGFLPDTLEKFKQSLQKPYGLILVCGPTGSGKSTTLYAGLNLLNQPDVKILTAEDPVEYNLKGVIQVQVNPAIGFTFAEALRAFLRQDPDIIMVGEIRDRETAQIAMEAALTGHLVLSTIHTNDAPSAIARLYEMKVPSFLISSSIECVLAQRLVRRVCKECAKPYQPSAEELKIFKDKGITDLSKAKFVKGVGKNCKACGETGYKGRTAIHELLQVDEEMRSLLLKEVAAGPIREFAIKKGMRPLLVDGLIKVINGITTLEEVIGAAQ
ncbi:MAG: ATPase, T2SS/T4P/T4SS family [bacterium]|nr:ATPase, T2SS/T4P/T4SS family [bacterium]